MQRQYGVFKKQWLQKHDMTRTTEPAFRRAQKPTKAEKAAEKALTKEDEEALEFKRLDSVRDTL